MVFKSAYVQKGYGIGGIFRSVAKIFRPIARNVTKVINQPEVQKVLKTIGKESASAGGELLLDSLRGNNIESKLNNRIKVAKRRIAESIQDGIRSRKRPNTKNYQRIDIDDYDDDDNTTTLPKISLGKHNTKPYQRLYTKRKKNGPTVRRGQRKSVRRTVFD